MGLRDEIEQVIRAWDKHERDRARPPIIDFDCVPSESETPTPANRVAVYDQLRALQRRLGNLDRATLGHRLGADLAYLRALMGQRATLDEYVRETQGCSAAGWSGEYVASVGEHIRKRLADVGVSWDGKTVSALEAVEGAVEVEDAGAAIRAAARSAENSVRALVEASAQYDLTIETAEIDSYWSYWLDGAGSSMRLRINRRRARFTEVQVRQFALHEILGHALQCASLAEVCARDDVPWVRLLSVHTGHSVVAEGLAQALPLFISPDDELLVTRVHLAHYLQLVRAELHLAINNGASVGQCVQRARSRVPFWDDEEIGNILSDRSVNPLLRSYLWSYPAGLDWFVALRSADSSVIQEVFRAAYRRPLYPAELAAMWPSGPAIGGS